MTELEYHPLASVFPLIDGQEFDDLARDIQVHGVREPIWLYEGKILDGRNRYRASASVGVDCPMRDYTGSDPIAFVVSLNLKRRHLTESQRAMVAARLANFELGDNQHTAGSANLPTLDAAQLLNVSPRSVGSARKVQMDGTAELQEVVERGRVSVSAAADVATLPEERQQEIVARGEREILEAAREIRAQKALRRRAERIDRIAEISAGNMELGTDKKYPIVYADPPWRYENPPMGDTSRSIENHYPTMSLDEICAVPVADITTDDCLLFMWATAPKLAECLQVIEAWGFEYRTNLVWVKDMIGMGYYVRNQHELLLICRKGEIPPPKTGEQPASVFNAPREAHSAKPPAFAEMIERLYPELPKIELFCRTPRDGWAVWGNQSGATNDGS